MLATACDINGNRPGCLRRSVANEIPFGDHDTSFSHMASVGVQRQFGAAMSIESNYVWTGGRKEEFAPNINLAYNPATGANLRFQDIALTPFPDWGIVRAEIMTKRSNYYGWENTLHQAVREPVAGERDVHAGVVQGRGAESVHRRHCSAARRFRPSSTSWASRWRRTLAACTGWRARDQRHRATFNGIWDMGMGFQLSGLYFFGSGERFSTSWGGDLRNMGANSTGRLRADGRLTPRNAFVGEPIHRVDMRLTKRQRIVGPDDDRWHDRGVQPVQPRELRVVHDDGEQRGLYGQPSFNANVAYQPRIAQVGFRFAF